MAKKPRLAEAPAARSDDDASDEDASCDDELLKLPKLPASAAWAIGNESVLPYYHCFAPVVSACPAALCLGWESASWMFDSIGVHCEGKTWP